MDKKIMITGVFIAFAIMVFACLPKAGNNMTAKPKTAVIEEKGIQFMEANWNKALQEAKRQNKPIFLDAYTSWCGPCRMLKNNTFTDKAVGDFFNKNFINIALDMEKGDGLGVAEKYQIRAYPTLIITNAEQSSVSVSEGYIGPAQLLEFGKYVLAKKNK